jgi:serine protease Do
VINITLIILYYVIIMNTMKKRFILPFITVLLALIILMPGCITITTPETSPATSANTTATATAIPIATSWTPTTTQTTQTTIALPNISDIVALVKPSVVAITTEVTVLDFFNRQYTEEGAGSGWIIDSSGIIVTNNHVVEGAKSITVTLDNGESYAADVKSVATDTLNDLAILKINARNLTALRIGDSSKLRVGDWVIAIGNSLGRGTRATVGIISQLGVSLQVDQDQTLYNLIDTSAAINPGNSGGPLVNLNGEVVGITSAKIVATGAEATGFAISTETATPVIKELVNKGFVSRPWIGVGLYSVDQTAIRQLKLAVNTGALVLQIGTNSPAGQAGLQKYDVIVSVGGQNVTDVSSFTLAINACKIGQPCEVKYWRGNTQNSMMITPIETPRT